MANRKTPSGRTLVIVESPAKAKTIAGYLGKGYLVESSIGHVRDLPPQRRRVPGGPKQECGPGSGSTSTTTSSRSTSSTAKKKSVVSDLAAAQGRADELLLATDEDREGEAIAWHLVEVLRPEGPGQADGVPRDHQARDRAAPSPTRARSTNGSSTPRRRAGSSTASTATRSRRSSGARSCRVSPRARAVGGDAPGRRARARADRVPLRRVLGHRRVARPRGTQFEARLAALAGEARPGPRLRRVRGADGRRTRSSSTRPPPRRSRPRSQAPRFAVASVERKPYTRAPGRPFMHLDAPAGGEPQARFSADSTMRVAQRLYENGFITYMRTDSTYAVGDGDQRGPRAGARALRRRVRARRSRATTNRKVKNAQEAHEAIRPAGDIFRTPERAAASSARRGRALRTRLEAHGRLADGRRARRDGFDPHPRHRLGRATTRIRDRRDSDHLPRVSCRPTKKAATSRPPRTSRTGAPSVERRGEPRTARAHARNALDHAARALHGSEPRPRLEERGIGRPSTYASILGTILDRGYVRKLGQALVPTFLAFAVTNLLEQHFGRLVDYEFTALMEDDLDRIASGDEDRSAWLRRFYFGEQGEEGEGLKALVSDLGDIDARSINTIPIGNGIELRVGRWGPYIERNGERATIAD